MSATINALIARGVDPIGSGLPQVANMLNAKQAQDTQSQYAADNHNALLDQRADATKNEQAKQTVAEAAQLHDIPDDQLPAAIQQMPHVVQALQGANIPLNNIPLLRATIDHAGRAAAAHLGIEPPRPKYGGPVAGTDAAGKPTFRRFNENGPDSIPVSSFAPPAKEETFGSPTDLVMGGKPSVAQIGSQGTVRPVAGASPYNKPAAALDANARLKPEDLDFMADQYLAGDKTVLQNLGRGAQGAANIVALRSAIRTHAQKQGVSPAETAAIMAEYQGTVAGERTLGTRTANIEMAGSEAANLATLALTASKEVPRGAWNVFNKGGQAWGRATNDPNLRKFDAANQSLVNVYARAISPNGVSTVADKDHGYALLQTADSQQAYEAVVGQMLNEISAARKSPGQVRAGFRDAMTGKSGASGSSGAPPATNAKGWTLHKDGNGNLAYVSPDGKSYEEVQR